MRKFLISFFTLTTLLFCASLMAEENVKLFKHEWRGNPENLYCHLELTPGLIFEDTYSFISSKTNQYQTCTVSAKPNSFTSFSKEGRELTKIEISTQIVNTPKANELRYTITTKSHYANPSQPKANERVETMIYSSGILFVGPLNLKNQPDFFYTDDNHDKGVMVFELVKAS